MLCKMRAIMKQKGPLVSVIVLSHDRLPLLKKTLESIKTQTYGNIETIIVENESRSSPVIRNWIKGKYTKARMIENVDNGYTGGMNLGLKEARGTLVQFQPDDIVLMPDFIDKMVKHFIAIPNVGLLNGMVYEDDRMTIIRFCGGAIHFGIRCKIEIFGSGVKDQGQFKQPFKNTFGGGAALMGDAEVIRRMGGFDEHYFMYYEDVDLSLRMLNAGYEIWVAPDAKCYHLGHAMNSLTIWGEKYMDRNEKLLYIKHAGNLQYLVNLLLQIINAAKSLIAPRYTAKQKIKVVMNEILWPLTHGIYLRITKNYNVLNNE